MGDRRGRPSPFGNIASQRIRGITTGVGGMTAGFPMPSFNTPPLRGYASTPSPRLRGRPANVRSSMEAFGRSAVAAFPANKRPRGTPNPAATGAKPPAYAGRAITPSFIRSRINAANRAEATWDTGDRTHDFMSYQRFVQANKGDLAFALTLKGQFVFNDRLGFQESGKGLIVPTHHRLGGRVLPGTPGRRPIEGVTRLLSLPVINYFLRRDDEIRPTGAITPEQVLERYAPEGVIRTDALELHHPAQRNTDVREYTVTIGGRDPDTTNIWGLVRQHQPLWLIVKRLPYAQAPKEYVISALDEIRRIPPQPGQGRQFHPNPIQIIPWSDPRKRDPDVTDLEYFDDLDQTTRYGIAICVGYVNEPADAADSRTLKAAWSDATMLMKLPRVDVTLTNPHRRII